MEDPDIDGYRASRAAIGAQDVGASRQIGMDVAGRESTAEIVAKLLREAKSKLNSLGLKSRMAVPLTSVNVMLPNEK